MIQGKGQDKKLTDSQQRTIDYLKSNPNPLLKILSGEIRYNIMNILKDRNMGYNEVRDDLRLNHKSRNYAFHLRILTQFNLIVKSQRNGLYNITVKGLRALHGAKLVNEAEMFI